MKTSNTLTDSVNIKIDLGKPVLQVIEVSISFCPKEEYVEFSLPVWTPGSYTVRDYAQNIFDVKVMQSGKNIKFNRKSINSWNFHCLSKEKIYLLYKVEARELTVRNSYLDSEFASLCMPSVIMMVKGHRSSSHFINVITPDSWNLYCPLPRNKNTYSATNYDNLVDAPIHAGIFNEHKFYVKGFLHKIIIISSYPGSLPSHFLSDLSKVCESACDLVGEDPPSEDNYLFVLFILDKGYGGLEHDNSSVNHFNWKLLHSENGYRKLLQLLGHEYFHQWNVRRLRPKEYQYYNYNSPVISDSLWFSEGLTSYYDLVFPYLAKLSTLEDLLSDLSEELLFFFKTPGINIQSLSDSSREAWVKLYKSKPYSIDTQVSYYKLGLVTVLCIDILLRQSNSSMSEIFRTLWLKYGKTNLGFTRKQILFEISCINPAISDKLNCWLDTPNSLPLEDILSMVGLQITPHYHEDSNCGFDCYLDHNHNIIISRVYKHSPDHLSGLAIGDEIIALNGFRVSTLNDLNTIIGINSKFNILYSRRGKISQHTINVKSKMIKKCTLHLSSEGDMSKSKLRDKWLNLI